jgi:CRISPR-associated protein Csb2
VPAGFQRWWVPNPLGIAETRALPALPDNSTWSIENAVQLSVGMVWRDIFGISGRGTKLYHDLASAAAEFLTVRQPRRIHGSSLPRYTHRTSSSTVITGYTALIDLGGLSDARTPVAIGQSRHLGTGLLTPVDIPESLSNGSGNLSWP